MEMELVSERSMCLNYLILWSAQEDFTEFVNLVTKITIKTRKSMVISLNMETIIMSVTTDAIKVYRSACKMPISFV
jgi:hypothetical protein